MHAILCSPGQGVMFFRTSGERKRNYFLPDSLQFLMFSISKLNDDRIIAWERFWKKFFFVLKRLLSCKNP